MKKATLAERWKAFRESVWGLLLIVIVMGGIYTGLFTPTEAAAMSAVYAFFIAVFVYKDMGLKDVPRVLLSSANMSAMLLYIITNAVLFSFVLPTRTSRSSWPTGWWAWAWAPSPSCWWSTCCCWWPATSWSPRPSC
jgi:TRAP-type C4-dicarboxylate transport system permease large subunit